MRVHSYREIKIQNEIETAIEYSKRGIFQKTRTVYLLRKTYYLVPAVHFSIPYLLRTDVHCREGYHPPPPLPRGREESTKPQVQVMWASSMPGAPPTLALLQLHCAACPALLLLTSWSVDYLY